MNRQQLWCFFWLRWRILVNRVKRTSTVNAVLTAILAVVGVVVSLNLFAGGIALGVLGMPTITSADRLYVWDGIVVMFLFWWLMGILVDLQRPEGLAIEKVLHLPVSPAGAFVINYLSSLLSLTLILFLPGMIGLALGQTFAFGPVMLLAFPLLAAFVFALTAITYQFKGWLASMMSNPRRRRTVVVLITAGAVLLVQLPNLLNVFRPWDVPSESLSPKVLNQQAELQRKFAEKRITDKELSRQTKAIYEEADADLLARQDAAFGRISRITWLVNGLLPPGWLAVGMADLADGHALTTLLGTLGLGLIGTYSLMRAYRTTIRLYTQGGTGDGRKPVAATPAGPPFTRPSMIEWKIPWISEYASAVAAAGFRSLLRAPEAKMMLLTPIILVVAFGGMFLTMRDAPLEKIGPFVPLGVVGMIIVSMLQVAGNLFGFDRGGFRTFVLSPAPRQEILLGKNLALAPVVLVFGLVVIVAVGFVFHLRLDQAAASIIQIVTLYLLFCLLTNACSIYAPYALPSGSLKAARPGAKVFLILTGATLISPLFGLPAVLPVVVELILAESDLWTGIPVSLALSAVTLAVVVWCYRRVLSWQGRLLSEREQEILEIVTGRAE